jgi:hypothetical protein
MTLECINPADLPAPLTYSHVVVTTGTRQVTGSPLLAGHCGRRG